MVVYGRRCGQEEPDKGKDEGKAAASEKEEEKKDIGWKELRGLVEGVATFRHVEDPATGRPFFEGKNIVTRCDNKGICQAALRRWTQVDNLMDEFRNLQLEAFRGNFQFRISWIRGVKNIVPDALSRLDEPGQWKRACESAQPPLEKHSSAILQPLSHPY